MPRVALFTPALERLSCSPLSFTEARALERLWRQGEDGWLREDERFRPTPWGRWIPSERYLINDLAVRTLRREGRSELSLAAQLEHIAEVVDRPTSFCPADPRLRLEGDRLRLSPAELSGEPLLEEVGELLQYRTHLPVLSLQAAAASEPAGEWGPAAEARQVEPLGWLRVEDLGRPLNRRMFIARIRGESMDGGRRPIPDGTWALFEFNFCEGIAYEPVGVTPVVLVRGAFHDPETGSYTIKRWDRGAEIIRLLSSHPDRTRFPVIEVPPEEAEALRVVAGFSRVLRPSDFARRPKPQRRIGRRPLVGESALGAIDDLLRQRLDDFFDASAGATGGGERAGGWEGRLVCLEAESGGLHLEIGPLDGLAPFVRKLRAMGQGWTGISLGHNARQRPVRLATRPDAGPWRWEAVGFEEETEDLESDRLALEALPDQEVTVFRVDVQGLGQRQSGGLLHPGQRYRLLLPPACTDLLDGETPGAALGGGWMLWSLEPAEEDPAALQMMLEPLGLALGPPQPSMRWVAIPPRAWRFNAQGQPYAAFGPNTEPVLRVEGLPAVGSPRDLPESGATRI